MIDEFASAIAGSSSQSDAKSATTQKSLDPPRPKDKLHTVSNKSIHKSSSHYPSSRSLERRLNALEGRLNANESKTQSQLDSIQSFVHYSPTHVLVNVTTFRLKHVVYFYSIPSDRTYFPDYSPKHVLVNVTTIRLKHVVDFYSFPSDMTSFLDYSPKHVLVIFTTTRLKLV